VQVSNCCMLSVEAHWEDVGTDVGKGLACFCLEAQLLFDKAVGISLVYRKTTTWKTRTQLLSVSSLRLAICCWCAASRTWSLTVNPP